MFSRKYYNRYLDDQFDRQYYGARLKLKKFDTDEFQSLSSIYNVVPGVDEKLETCIEVRDVSFHYNSFTPILNKISLTVPQGKIYALLGASGCGKTTLLRMLLGRLKPIKGKIKVFGMEPGSPMSNIPGPGVGYMPQELALFMPFTINEVLHYYGRLYGMHPETIKKRVTHFITLLNLPTKHRRVEQLSGGQQRRVSLAVTMLHHPPLLILDEPTVGVDSVLRLRIWNYLEELCKKRGTTVLITTHYTEEARNSYRVGFIDSGTMLAEDNPQKLLYKYNCISLEDVFLELCLEKSQVPIKNQIIMEEDEETEAPVNEIMQRTETTVSVIDRNNNSNQNVTNSTVPKAKATEKNGRYPAKAVDSHNLLDSYQRSSGQMFNRERLFAQLKKNFILFKRNPVSIVLLNIIPILQVSLYCISFARNPHDIPVAVVNHENKSLSLSNLFLEHVDNKSINLVHYNNEYEAIESVKKVKSWLALSIPANFTRNFKRRFTRPERVTNKTIEGSTIGLYPDNAHAVFALYTYNILMQAFEAFIFKVGSMLGYNPTFFGSPIQLTEPVFGSFDINYSSYIAPAMIICIVHGMTMLIGSFCIVRDRNEGHLERGFVAGIKPSELLLSHMIFLVLPVLSQVVFTLFLSFYVYHIPLEGSLLDVFAIAFLQALQGLVFGVALSIVCPSEVASLILVFSIEMPFIFTSGTLWPLESLGSNVVRNALLWNPLTMPINSMRDVMMRGRSLFHFNVMFGVITSLTYTALITLSSFIFFEILNYT